VSGVDISANPEVVKRTVTLDDLKQKLNALENTQKEFEYWKRVEVDGKKNVFRERSHVILMFFGQAYKKAENDIFLLGFSMKNLSCKFFK
jgi:hypothetical protein